MKSLKEDNRPVYYIILLALKSGMRFAEIIALTKKILISKTTPSTLTRHGDIHVPMMKVRKRPKRKVQTA